MSRKNVPDASLPCHYEMLKACPAFKTPEPRKPIKTRQCLRQVDIAKLGADFFWDQSVDTIVAYAQQTSSSEVGIGRLSPMCFLRHS